MPSTKAFFDDQTEQSAVKAHIVASYFTAWSRVIKKWNCSRMGYVDLFCGPGKYNDNKPTTPIQIIQSTLQDPTLRKRMYFLFNDNNPENIEALKKFISEVDTLDALRGRISYNTQTVDKHI